jgi:O-antigen/teichoic acid export membrane protein
VASAFYAERSHAAAGPVRASLPRAAVVVLAVIGLPALILFTGGGRILGLFSSDYATGGGTLLKILVVAAVPDAITNLAVAHWRSLGLFGRCRSINLLMAAVGLSLTWLWLPHVGIAAAGFAWLAGQGAGAVATAVVSLSSRPFGNRRQLTPKNHKATRAPRVLRPAPGPRAHRAAPARRRNEASVR